jgi:hypothetical protein
MKKKLAAALLSAAAVTAFTVGTATSADAVTGCTKNTSGTYKGAYTCGAWGTSIQLHDHPGSGGVLGTVNATGGKFPWVLCKVKGQTVSYGGYTNNWWIDTTALPDWKFSGVYVSAIFLTQSANEPAGLPLCY